MNDEQQLLWDWLQANALGRENSKIAKEICESTKIKSGGKTFEHIRSLLRELILNHNCLIGGDNGGYWIIENVDELNHAVTNLNQRSAGNLERARKLQDIWDNRMSKKDMRIR